MSHMHFRSGDAREVLKTIRTAIVPMRREIKCLKLAESVSRQRKEEDDLEEETLIFSAEEDVLEDMGELVGQQEEEDDAICGTQV